MHYPEFPGQAQECRNDLDSHSGTISPPDSDNDGRHDTDLDCIWTIAAGANQVVQLFIESVNIKQDSEECGDTFLKVQYSEKKPCLKGHLYLNVSF